MINYKPYESPKQAVRRQIEFYNGVYNTPQITLLRRQIGVLSDWIYEWEHRELKPYKLITEAVNVVQAMYDEIDNIINRVERGCKP